MLESITETEELASSQGDTSIAEGIGNLFTHGQWSANENFCAICQCEFSKRKLNPRHHCRICGLAVCGACSPSQVQLEGFKKLERACTPCVANAQMAPALRSRLGQLGEQLHCLGDSRLTKSASNPDTLEDAVAVCEAAVSPLEDGRDRFEATKVRADKAEIVASDLKSEIKSFEAEVQAAKENVLKLALSFHAFGGACLEADDAMESGTLQEAIEFCRSAEAPINEAFERHRKLAAKLKAEVADEQSQRCKLEDQTKRLESEMRKIADEACDLGSSLYAFSSSFSIPSKPAKLEGSSGLQDAVSFCRSALEPLGKELERIKAEQKAAQERADEAELEQKAAQERADEAELEVSEQQEARRRLEAEQKAAQERADEAELEVSEQQEARRKLEATIRTANDACVALRKYLYDLSGSVDETHTTQALEENIASCKAAASPLLGLKQRCEALRVSLDKAGDKIALEQSLKQSLELEETQRKALEADLLHLEAELEAAREALSDCQKRQAAQAEAMAAKEQTAQEASTKQAGVDEESGEECTGSSFENLAKLKALQARIDEAEFLLAKERRAREDAELRLIAYKQTHRGEASDGYVRMSDGADGARANGGLDPMQIRPASMDQQPREQTCIQRCTVM